MHRSTSFMRRPTLYMMVSCTFTCLFLHDIYVKRRVAPTEGEEWELPEYTEPGASSQPDWGLGDFEEAKEPETTTLPALDAGVEDVVATEEEEGDGQLLLDFREPHLDTGLIEDDANSLLAKVKAVVRDNTILVVLLTRAQVDIGCNFYISSLVRHNITNYMFIGLDQTTCHVMTSSLRAYNVNCFVYATDEYVEEAFLSTFNSKKKLHFHVKLIHQLLSYGLTVAYSDVESYLLRDALSVARSKCERRKCDVMAPLDGDVYNLGFLYATPTPSTRQLYQGMLQLAGDTPSIEQAFTWSLRNMLEHKHPIKVFTFPRGSFVSTDDYFQNHTCPHIHEYNTTLAILPKADHSVALTSLRLKDCLMWNIDRDAYYSSLSRRYVMYESPIDLGKMNKALLNLFLFGSAANRTVILPRFYKPKQSRRDIYPSWAVGASYLDVHELDRASTGYRESTFLQHHLVPRSVKSSLSRPYQITQIEVAGSRKLKDVIPIVVNSSATAVLDIGRVLGKSRDNVAQLKPFLRYMDEEVYAKYLGQRLSDLLSRLRY